MASEPAVPAAAEPPARGVPPWAPYLLGLGLLLCFSGHLMWLWERWMNDEFYGHGMFVPVISGYIVYRHLPALRALPREGFTWGLPVIGLGLVTHIAATWLDVNFPSGFALIITLYGLVIWLWGWPVARAVAFPFLYLVFMVPVARFLVDQYAQPMQRMSASFGGAVANAIGIPAVIDGTKISIPEYSFEVAVACSGLKSAVSMTALAALYAWLLVAPFWKRAAVFVSSLPVALLANGSRIALTLVLARTFGPKAAEGFIHTSSGVVVFLIALLGLFLVGALLKCSRIRDDI
jgi:exosortase